MQKDKNLFLFAKEEKKEVPVPREHSSYCQAERYLCSWWQLSHRCPKWAVGLDMFLFEMPCIMLLYHFNTVIWTTLCFSIAAVPLFPFLFIFLSFWLFTPTQSLHSFFSRYFWPVKAAHTPLSTDFLPFPLLSPETQEQFTSLAE